MEIIKPDDIIWIHDYHLMLLPRLIREEMPKAMIGFFSPHSFSLLRGFQQPKRMGEEF
ncbi:MAG: trehalose-6-phosphate synthase [Candidatus Methanospirareceae archaeon]